MSQRTLDLDSYNTGEQKISTQESTKQEYKSRAHEMAKAQREISVAEFFEKNRHLLGFDNKRKALLTTIKEAVDNALDACEEADILPEIEVRITDMGNERFRIVVEDNGPGIVKKQVPLIFGKLLYGSKFHSLKQSRGQQGIGISAAALYGQLTTGKPIKILSKIHPNEPGHLYELHLDTSKNKPQILKQDTKDWYKEHGTRIELEMEATYQKGAQSVDQYLKQTAIVNPHVTINYTTPKNEILIFPRATSQKPEPGKEIKPHPYGIELGILIKMINATKAKTVQQFLQTEFSRVSASVAKQICEEAAILPNTKPAKVSREMADKMMKAIRRVKIMAPPTDCISPISADLIEKGLKKEINAEYYCTTTRPPAVYRGNPFIIEAGIAYGGELKHDGSVEIMRFANRVPLQYQQGACAITDAIIKTAWRNYGISQSSGSLPQGPMAIVVHMGSVWVPFTSEAKEALAHYPEIMKEIRLALQECGRQLASYVRKKKKVKDEFKKRSYIERYIPHVGLALKELLKLDENEVARIEDNLKSLLEKHRGKIDSMDFDPNSNTEYDADMAKIGRGEQEEGDEE